MAVIEGLKCVECDAESAAEPFRYVCPKCGGNCYVVYPPARLERSAFSRGKGQARYLALLPLASADSLPPIMVGGTPLYRRDDLASELGLGALFFKDEGRQPSGSFKDRASAVILARARELGVTEICAASTGNAAAAIACLGAAAGVHPYIFVPKTAPRGKIAQLVTFGARIFLVDGNYDAACDLALAATERFGWYNRNTGFNPYTREGKKTVSFELLEDHAWIVPDVVIVAVGDGNIISGVHKGFRDARDYGLIERMPRLIAAQSELSAAVANAVRGDGRIRPVAATTIADSISVNLPRDGAAAVRAVKETGGAAVTVSDEAILEAQRWLARRTGIFAEPAAACAAAGLIRAAADGIIGERDSVTVIITGNGLKDVEAVTRRLPDLPLVAPEIGALEAVIARRA